MLSLGNYLVHSVYHNVKLLFSIGTRGNPIVSSGQGFSPPIGQEAPLSCGCCTCACNGPAGNWQFHTCLHEGRQNCSDFFGRAQRWNRNARHHPPHCRCCRSRRCPVCNRNRSRSPLYPEALHPDRTRTRRRHCPHESRSCIACLHCEFLNDNESDSNRQGTPSSKNSASKLLSCHEEDDVGSGDFLNRNGGNDSDVELYRCHRTSSCHTSTTKFVTCREEVDSCSKDGTDADVSDNESEILCDSKDKPVCERDSNKENTIEIAQVESNSGNDNNKQDLEVLNVFINKRLCRKLERVDVDVLDNEELSDSQSSSVFHGFNEYSEDEWGCVGSGDLNGTDGTGISNKFHKSSGSGLKSTKYVRTFIKGARTSVTKCFVKECNGFQSEEEATDSGVGPTDVSTRNIDENLGRSSGVCSAPSRSQRTREILDGSSSESFQSYKVNSKKCHKECMSTCKCDTQCRNLDENFPKKSDLEVEFLKKPSDQSFCISPEETSEGTISLESESQSLPKKSDGKVSGRSKKGLKRKINTNSESPLKRNEKEYLDRPTGDVGNLTSLESCKSNVGNSKAYLEKKVTESVSIKLGKDLLPEKRGKDTIERSSGRKGKVHSKRTQTAVLNVINRKVSGISHEDRSDVNGKSSEVHFEKRSNNRCWGKTRYNLKRYPKDTVSKSLEYCSNTSSGISFKRNSDINLDESEHVSPKKKRKGSCVNEHDNVRRKASKKKCLKTNQEISSRRSIVPRVEIRGVSHSCCLCRSGNTSERHQNKRQYKSSNSEVSSDWNYSSAQSREKKGTQSASREKNRCNSSLTRSPKCPNDETNTSTTNYFAQDININNEQSSVVEVWHCSSNQTSESSNVIGYERTESGEENDSLDSDTGSGKHCKGCGLPISSGRRKFVWQPKFARKDLHSKQVVESGHPRLRKSLESQLVSTGKLSRKSMGKSGIGAKCRKCMFLSLRGLKKVTVNPFINFYLVYLRNMQQVCPKCAPVKKVAAEAGKIWRCMSEKERKPFMKMALVARSHLDGAGSFHAQLKPLESKFFEKRTINAHHHSAPKPTYKNEPKIRQNQRSVGTDNPNGRMRWRKRAATHPRGRMDQSPLKLFMIKRRKEDKESNTERPLYPQTHSD